MPAPVIDSSVGGSASNSYLTVVEAEAYFATRVPLVGWSGSTTKELLLIMATRVLDRLASPLKTLVPGTPAYYRVRPQWTGTPATTTQILAWPRSGMFDANGNAIAIDVIPQALKEAVAELAGQLGTADRTLDNDVIVQGLTSVRAGSVSLAFKDSIMPKVIPDMVYNLMPASWLTAELYEPVFQAEFDVASFGTNYYGW